MQTCKYVENMQTQTGPEGHYAAAVCCCQYAASVRHNNRKLTRGLNTLEGFFFFSFAFASLIGTLKWRCLPVDGKATDTTHNVMHFPVLCC